MADVIVSSTIDDLLQASNAAAARTAIGAIGAASPTFTGTPTAPTAAEGTNTTQIATTAFVTAAIAAALATDTTAPTISSTTPADDSTDISISGNLTATFSEAVQFHSSVSIAIKRTADDTTFEAFDETDIGTGISISGSTLTINPTSNLANNVSYYVTIGSTSIKDTADTPNYFAGISSKTVWNFTTVAASGSLPSSGLLFDLDASLMTGTNNADITQFTDRSGLSNHASTSGSPIAPPKFHNTEGPSSGKCIKFANGGSYSNCTTTDTSTTVTTTSTAGLVAGMLISGTGIPADTTIASVTSSTEFELSQAAEADGTVTLSAATPASELLTLADDAPVTDFHLFIRGKSALNGCFLTNAAISAIFCSVANNGTNKFYFAPAAGSAEYLSGTASVNPTSTYSVIEVLRSGSTITVRQNGSDLATGTTTGTPTGSLTAAKIGYAMTGNIARIAMYNTVKTSTDLTTIRTAFGL